MVTLRNIENRKMYDLLEHYIFQLCKLQLNIVANPAKINEKDFYGMFLEELLGHNYTSLNDLIEKNRDKLTGLE